MVEGGCTLWDVYSQMYEKWGVTIPSGSCFTVVGGRTVITITHHTTELEQVDQIIRLESGRLVSE